MTFDSFFQDRLWRGHLLNAGFATCLSYKMKAHWRIRSVADVTDACNGHQMQTIVSVFFAGGAGQLLGDWRRIVISGMHDFCVGD